MKTCVWLIAMLVASSCLAQTAQQEKSWEDAYTAQIRSEDLHGQCLEHIDTAAQRRQEAYEQRQEAIAAGATAEDLQPGNQAVTSGDVRRDFALADYASAANWKAVGDPRWRIGEQLWWGWGGVQDYTLAEAEFVVSEAAHDAAIPYYESADGEFVEAISDYCEAASHYYTAMCDAQSRD